MAGITLPGFTNPTLSDSVWGGKGGLANWFKNYNDTSTWNKWMGNNGIIPIGLAGLQTLGGLLDWQLGVQNYNLAKDAYEFQTALANRNLANQAKLINNRYDTAATVGAQLSGYDYDRALASQQDQARKQHVDGSYIG